ncbi:hypothetical protein N7474_005476 [Penicillium riverlandense]|uniref:uncharacterized protein n=1 Tax=Penicillium riverlandense TaxID=1903569 RepID=UPI002546D5D9|nr:uncharacterized protein N7474_005476 [Penicillium riverlandense]KAJ5819885.1 hypothetical protein N7474_005476 [Penicillium riverlandense]
MPSSNPDFRGIGAWQSNIKIPKDTVLKIGSKSTGTSSKTYTKSKSSPTFVKSTSSSPWSSVNRRT